MRVHTIRRLELCSLGKEGWRTTRFPGSRDQCPGCGRIVYTRADGTCVPHHKPAYSKGVKE